MQPLSHWPLSARRQITGVFTDIDDTLTTDGAITPDALQALADLQAAGLCVIAITGRPVGWSVPFAAAWPVDAIVAENGAVAILTTEGTKQIGTWPSYPLDSLLSKIYQQDLTTRTTNQVRMRAIAARVETEVPGVQRSRDSAGRETDLAFDYAEFAQHAPDTVQRVLALLQAEGMHTTVSSIHIHGCFGEVNKWTGACWITRTLLGRELPEELNQWVFVGDSGNDQPMFQHLRHSVGVANIARCAQQLAHRPAYVTPAPRGAGFAEVAQAILRARASADACPS